MDTLLHKFVDLEIELTLVQCEKWRTSRIFVARFINNHGFCYGLLWIKIDHLFKRFKIKVA